MRYSLEKDNNGRITQCENGDGNGNVYAQRKELNKLALKNVKRPTPGKLGDLSNMQIFNFELNPGFTGSANSAFAEYNTTVTGANVVDCVMFGVPSIIDKALYYNIVDIKATCFRNVNNQVEL